MAYRSKPTPDQRRKVCAYVRAGAFVEQALEASGIQLDEFEAWVNRVQQPRARKEVREFVDEVRAAAAQARVRAEMDVFGQDPKTWLKNGPGKDQVGQPGWTTTAPPERSPGPSANIMEDPAWTRTVSKILHALKDFPEARAAIAEALESDRE